jgi:hypothetical protein
MKLLSMLSGLAAAGAASAQIPLTSIGTLPAPFDRSSVAGVSADGSLVYGSSSYTVTPTLVISNAVIWTRQGGLESIGTLGGVYAAATGAAADGSVVYGSGNPAGIGPFHPFRWTRAGGMQDLGLPAGAQGAGNVVVSADGTAIAGDAGMPSGPVVFRWTQAGGFQTIAPGLSVGAISSDGSVILCNSGSVAYRWSEATGLQSFPPSPIAWLSGEHATWVSRDGLTAIGSVYVPGNDPSTPFTWTVGGAIQTVPPNTPYLSLTFQYATLDASIVVSYDGLHGTGPFLFRGSSLVLLTDYLRARGVDASPWPYTSFQAASNDLRTFVGNTIGPSGQSEGWVVTVPTGCYANCDDSSAPPLLNVNDFICFINQFASGNPYANCDGSTIAPVLTVNDFVCFQQKFAAGCSE